MAASNAGVAGQGAASAISNNAAVTATNNANMNSPSSLGLVNNNTSKVSNATSKYIWQRVGGSFIEAGSVSQSSSV